jgi:solute carrier family 8 (sodium/calcium exchanger)
VVGLDEWWGWMRGQLIDEFRGKEVLVSGDGQCDSPGFNNKNLCYFIVEVSSDYIIHVEIADNRQVGLVSNNMEKGLKKSLKKLQEDLNVVELVTDASSSIKKLLGRFNIYFN